MVLAEPDRRLRNKFNASGAGKLKTVVMVRSESFHTHIARMAMKTMHLAMF